MAIAKSRTDHDAGADLAFAGAIEQAELVRAGEVKPRELVELHLARIERLDPQLRAFRVVLADQALEQAKALARRKPTDDQPLFGVPVAIKDDVAVAGQPIAWGSRAHGGPEREDSLVVARLRAAGAIVIGITAVPELTIWPFTESAAFGATRNPWDPSRTPGGSSGGTGAAVASGMVPLGLGSDGGGSVRIPSAWCGLFGIKPQRGRVPLLPRKEAWNGLSVDGPLARRVADAALFLDVTSGAAAGEGERSPPAPERSFAEAARTPPGKLRVAVSYRVPPPLMARIDPEVRGATDETAAVLRSLGHEVREQDPDYGLGTARFIPRYLAGIAEDAESMAHPERLERRTKGMARYGRLVRPLLERSTAGAVDDLARIMHLFDDFDVLMTPATAVPAPPVGRFDGHGAFFTFNGVAMQVPFNAVWNHTGQPAVSVPAGLTAGGLPLSVQLIGRPNDEATLISLAAQLEAERPWADRRPPIS